MIESGFTMVFHAAVIVALLYGVMRYLLGQRPSIAEDRSVFFGALALLYMVVFGHGAPTQVNPRLF